MALKKVKASAMQFAIFVATMIAILLGTFLTLTQTHQFFSTQSNFVLESIDAADQGIQYGLNPNTNFKDSVLLSSENLQTTIYKNSWGGFETLKSTGTIKNKSFTKKALIGTAISAPNTSIYLADTELPLVLVGNTNIEGTAYVSEKGIKPGTIAGNYFNGNQLINGSIKKSSGHLPKLSEGWKIEAKNLLEFIILENDEVIAMESIITNSFFQKPKVIYSSDAILLNEEFIGNILIKSDLEIIVHENARLVDVTLVAPKITLKQGFNGVVSCIASESLTLEENVHLTYPSALVLIDSNKPDEEINAAHKIPLFISENSQVEGTVTYIENEQQHTDIKQRSKVQLEIEPNTTIVGQVYCEGNVELSGTVVGSIYTHRFITNASGSRYINHIYNGRVLANNIMPEYCGLPFENGKKGIVKWLY